MGLLMTVTNVRELSSGVWELDLPPHQFSIFGRPANSLGNISSLMLKKCFYDQSKKQLQFEAENVVPLNVGTTSRTVAFLTGQSGDADYQTNENKSRQMDNFALGDREFLALAKRELSSSMAEVAHSLLRQVRARSPGNLKRGQSRNFSETPDNFWYVIIQPRISELSVTVRGPPDHFEGISKLRVIDDRGNTRFKIRNASDITEALKLIFHAIRK